MESFESAIDPFFAVEWTSPEEKRASHTASHAVIPAGRGNIDEMHASDRHGASPGLVC
jgi:hypothetical protein